jgi:phosphatidylglycerophosphate synthase
MAGARARSTADTRPDAGRERPAPPATTTAPPRGFREALAGLRTVQKTAKGAPAYSRLVNRRLGRVLAAAAYTARMTPDQVTAVSAACTFAGIATIAAASPSPATAAAVCLLLVAGYALDAADGQLARLRGGGSIAGEWLDHVVDAAKIGSLHLAVLINWYRFLDRSDGQLLIPIAFQVTASVVFFVIMLNDRIRRAQRGSSAMLLAGDGTSSTLYSLAVAPTDYGVLCLSFALMAWEASFLWVYSALMVANAAFAALALAKWYREMRAYDAA